MSVATTMTIPSSCAGSQRSDIVTDNTCMSEDDWNTEAANMIEEVLKTQQEVSDLLAKNSSVTSELQALKESCSKDLQELQEDAWKLQIYAELEKMSRQLELLDPLAQAPSSNGERNDDVDVVEQHTSHVDEAAEATVADSGCVDDTKLQAFDEEITALNKQISAAKEEMQAMFQMKLDLEKELQSLQLEG